MRAVSLAVALAFLSAPAFALQTAEPTLADTAAKEKQRRSTAKPAKKSFTNDDLGWGAGIVGSEPESATPKKEGEKPEKTDLEIKAEKRAEYEKQIAEEQRMIAVIQKAKQDAERELGDFANLTLGTRRQSLAQLVEDADKELAERQQKIAEIEEQARREGVTLSH